MTQQRLYYPKGSTIGRSVIFSGAHVDPVTLKRLQLGDFKGTIQKAFQGMHLESIAVEPIMSHEKKNGHDTINFQADARIETVIGCVFARGDPHQARGRQYTITPATLLIIVGSPVVHSIEQSIEFTATEPCSFRAAESAITRDTNFQLDSKRIMPVIGGIEVLDKTHEIGALEREGERTRDFRGVQITCTTPKGELEVEMGAT